MWLIACVNEMTPFEPYAAVVKVSITFDSDSAKGSLHMRRDV